MSEKRCRASTTVLLRNRGKTIKLELFDARSWDERPEAMEGRYRIRVQGQWNMAHGKYTFHTPAGILALLEGLLFGDSPDRPADAPALKRGDFVEFMDPESGFMVHRVVQCRPVLCIDGVWRVFVSQQSEPLAVQDIERAVIR